MMPADVASPLPVTMMSETERVVALDQLRHDVDCPGGVGAEGLPFVQRIPWRA